MSAYVFVLCPPFSGSTVLAKLLATSAAVSGLPSEGQFVPEVRDVMRRSVWDETVRLPWPEIREVWHRYWDSSKPLLLEKSPPNLIRTRDIVEHFSPAYFLVMVRNPYAHCESMIRRYRRDPTDAAEFSIRCMRRQAENAQQLEHVLRLTYEELAGDPPAACRQIESFIPGVGVLAPDRSFAVHSSHGEVDRGIIDLNATKLRNLSAGTYKRINRVLRQNPDVMAYWGYDYYEPQPGHSLAFARTRGGLMLSAIAARVRLFSNQVARTMAVRSGPLR